MDQLQHLSDYALQAIPKKKIIQRATEEAQLLIESGEDVTPAYVQALRVQEYAKTYIESLKPKVVDEIEPYGKETVRILGAKVGVMESGIGYDYSHCQDPEWNRMKNELGTLQEQIKEREALLRALKNPIDIHDPSSGELYTVYPPLRKSSTVPKVTY